MFFLPIEAGTTAALILGTVGLVVGGFLTRVVARFPEKLRRSWLAECEEMHTNDDSPSSTEHAGYNLITPGAHCPQCNRALTWDEQIPVLSYILQRGQCRGCHGRIGGKYPIIEIATAALFAACGMRWGLGITALAWAGFSATLICLSSIDWETTMLPDDITLPLVWSGLCAAGLGISGTSLTQSLWGAVFGYLSLWLLYWALKLATGKESMGYGDFKLLAALGAWLGASSLLPVILVASISGSVVGIAMHMGRQLREGRYVPFGPFLALGGWGALFYQDFLLSAFTLS